MLEIKHNSLYLCIHVSIQFGVDSMSANKNLDQLARLQNILASGPCKAPELQRILGVSQPTLSRLIRRAGKRIFSLGASRARFYALPRVLADVGSEIEVFKVEASGDVGSLGTLFCLAGAQYYWQPKAGKGTLFRHLPWFVHNVRPEGFLGRAFAHKYHAQGFPERLSDWNDEHLLRALTQYGADLPGNFIFGTHALSAYLKLVHTGYTKVLPQERSHVYPEMALDAMAGNPPGSSAGGEQPKFTAVIQDEEVRHVIVKFSPPVTTPEGQRWADLLVSEHLALSTLEKAGRSVSASEILFSEHRCFLEVQRFDRTGDFGRCATATLGIIEDELFGVRDSWDRAAQRLEEEKMLSGESVRAIRLQSAFGKLIANTDQHFGNISFFVREWERFELAPAYDVLPMFYSPASTGEIISRHYYMPAPGADLLDVWSEAQTWALCFWERVCADSRISEDFRSIAQRHVEDLRRERVPCFIG